MHFIAWLMMKWIAAALVLMAAVAIVAPSNPRNTLTRGLVSSAVIALIATPLAHLWWILFIPLFASMIVWFAVIGSYGLGFFRAIAVGIIGSVIGYGVDLLMHNYRGFP